MSKFTEEQREALCEQARKHLERKGFVPAAPPPADRVVDFESRADRHRRETAEREAAERTKSRPLTDYQAAQQRKQSLMELVAAEREYVLQVVGEALGEYGGRLRAELEREI